MPSKPPQLSAKSRSALISRNIPIAHHRTSVRLEPEMWTGLTDICRRERTNMNEICTVIVGCKLENSSPTVAIRVFVMAYFRAAATEDGHGRAGHGHGITAMNRATVTSLPTVIGASYPKSASPQPRDNLAPPQLRAATATDPKNLGKPQTIGYKTSTPRQTSTASARPIPFIIGGRPL